LGAYVTGTTALAARAGAQVLAWGSVVLYVLLVAAWLVVSGRSLAHAARHG
jgi:hypothetical protein